MLNQMFKLRYHSIAVTKDTGTCIRTSSTNSFFRVSLGSLLSKEYCLKLTP